MNGKLIEIRSALEDSSRITHDVEDPFSEQNENHNLIGVANIYLSCLKSDIIFEYRVPIISQQGEVSGRLHIQIQRVSGFFPDEKNGRSEINSSESIRTSDYKNVEQSCVVVRVRSRKIYIQFLKHDFHFNKMT